MNQMESLEMKQTSSEMNCHCLGLSIFDNEKEEISKLEDMLIKTIQIKQRVGGKLKKN